MAEDLPADTIPGMLKKQVRGEGVVGSNALLDAGASSGAEYPTRPIHKMVMKWEESR
jgi:hypothetical protein